MIDKIKGAATDVLADLIREIVKDEVKKALQSQDIKRGMNIPPGWVKVEEAAKLLSCSKDTVWRMVRDKEIPPEALRKMKNGNLYSVVWLQTGKLPT